ncbi:MAG: succinate--CoA ligase subunit beta [Theionarchaea archaeon]|nr:succinate--CoA ligase subunit beta [Theionarchaea archaeon]
MRLYEFEAKHLMEKSKIPVPQSMLIKNPDEAKKAAEDLGKVALKAQALVGGRAKAGGVLFADTPKEAEEKAETLLNMKISGYKVHSVLAEQFLDIKKELYLSVTIDRIRHQPVIIASSEGGIDIEDISRKYPEKVITHHIPVGESISPYLGREIARQIGLKGKDLTTVGAVITRMYNLFLKYDGKLLEINPLAVTDAGFFAADAVFNLDEDALYRHPDLKEMGISVRHELGELSEREKKAQEYGFPYVDLEGYVGVFPGGAGFGIAAIDLIKKYGGEPANFMDSGGGPTVENMERMIGLLMDNPKVTGIFGARFGGISRCDLWAEAVIGYLKKRAGEGKEIKPMIMRMTGHMEKEGQELFERAKKENPVLFENVKVYGIETPIEDVIIEAVNVAKERRG